VALRKYLQKTNTILVEIPGQAILLQTWKHEGNLLYLYLDVTTFVHFSLRNEFFLTMQTGHKEVVCHRCNSLLNEVNVFCFVFHL
jgi:hypothetical protein